MIIRISFLLLILLQAAWPQGVIRLKTRNLVPAEAAAPVHPGGASVARHFLVLFGSYPGPDVVAQLASRRIQVLAYVPENALMVSTEVLNLQGLDVTWSGPMEAADKISPVVTASGGAYLVLFQPDTDMTANQALVENLGFAVIPNSSLLAGQLVVSGAFSGLSEVAALDQVAYILPASLSLQGGDIVMACGGALTESGPVAQYVQMDAGWSKDANGSISLQYFFDSVTPKIEESLVRSEIARAFAEWARYANITFTAATEPGLTRSIDILFARFAHGDAYPFSGPGGQIAHTFYPAPYVGEPVAGDMHLNADEPWSVDGSGVDLFSVALHETGHALGLAHSDNPSAVMYPYYSFQTGLTPDDIAGIQAIYGAIAPSSPAAPVSSGSAGASATGSTGTGTAGSGTSSGTSSSTSSSTSAGASNTSTSSASNTGTGTTSGADTVPPTLSIVNPGSTIVSTSSATISVSGTAADNVAVSRVTWTTSTGGSGTASGTTAWSATIPLLVGDNVVTVRAYDAAGNSTWRALTVVRN